MGEPGAARYYDVLGDGSLRCSLCHRRCVIRPGATGACGVRANEGGAMRLPLYGRVHAASVDPMEKKPLYHFRPGEDVFSIGFLGCNLRCPFCQNYACSQSTDGSTEAWTPEDVAGAAVKTGCRSVAYTYSEPLVHAEFVEDAMAACRDAGLANVLVTNGCASEAAARGVLARCDAVNVDVKAWDAGFYRSELGGDLESTLAFVRLAFESGVACELTTLVIPGKNDDDAQIDGIASFAASLSPDIPLHLSAYRPMYLYTGPSAPPPTPESTLRRLAAVAGRRLAYVYVGNVAGEGSQTLCRSCGAVLVRRRGYSVDASGLALGRCAACGAASPIRS